MGDQTQRLHTSISFSGTGRTGSRLRVELGGSAACAAAAGAAALRHPRPHGSEPAPLDPHAQRVVATLLHELDAARQQGEAAHAELAAMKSELLLRGRGRGQPAEGEGSGAPGRTRLKAAAAAASGGGVQAPSGRIKAFRTPGQAPPPRAAASRQLGRPAASPDRTAPTAATAELAALQQDNAEMRAHLQTLLHHCQQLQCRLDESATARSASPHQARHMQQPPAVRAVAHPAEAEGLGGFSQQQRPRSPGRATVVVASPRAHGADLAVAVFEPPPEDAGELRLALNRMQRQNLKLSSKLSKAQEEAAERGAEARRWQQAVERQAGEIGSLRVELEGERRRQRELEAALAAAAGEVAAAQEHMAAVLGQLAAAEAAASAAEGEAASLRSQLAAVEEQRMGVRHECERLKDEAGNTAARLSATDLVRREAERERDTLELQVQRLQAALGDAEASGSATAEDLSAELAAAKQQVAIEQQRNDMLQAQLSLAEAQARETERVLTEQLRAVQEERNTCLAAATRADALLVRLGQHALSTRGTDR